MSSACSTEGVTRASELDAAAADSGESGASTDSGAGEPGESDGTTVKEDAQDGGFPPRECTAEIAAGARHSCARAQDGRIWCWGSNGWGQLTGSDHGSGWDGPDVAVPAPREVQGLRGPATLVAAGSLHTCAAIDDGTVWCWGDNSSGQLGHGTFTDLEPVPVQVLGMEGGLLSIAMNGSQDRQQTWEDPIVIVHHTCAVKVDGTVWCWGADWRGQLGGGKLHAEPVAEPRQVTALGTDAVRVSAGRLHACAVKANGKVWCWGDNVSGQVGNGTTADVALPVEVPGLDNAIEVSAGGDHSCVVTAEGNVMCWGANRQGQCGVAGTPHYPPFIYQPTLVSGLGAKALHVAASIISTCAVLEDGSVACWGSNCGGQLGNGSFGPEPYCSTATPGRVLELQNAVSIASTGVHSCSATLADEIWCWGDNETGELGDGTVSELNVDVPWPVKVLPYCP
jgi:alpha-tubulin suppressor-like RCC1 family protein